MFKTSTLYVNQGFKKENMQVDYDENLAPEGYSWGKYLF